jgi:hypothetical protein
VLEVGVVEVARVGLVVVIDVHEVGLEVKNVRVEVEMWVGVLVEMEEAIVGVVVIE